MSLMRLTLLAASATLACARTAFIVDDGGDDGCAGCTVLGSEFPRLAVGTSGDPRLDAGYDQWASKHKIVMFSGDWDGWDQSNGRSRDAVVMGIKNQSTIGTLVFQSLWLDDYDPSGASVPWSTFRSEIAANNWFLWTQGNAGTHVLSAQNSTWWQLNMAPFGPTDTNGERLEAAFARFIDGALRTGGTSNASSHLDGFVQRMTHLVPLGASAGDYNRDGTTDSQTSQQSMDWWQAGVRTFFDWFHGQWPQGLVGGAATSWGSSPNGLDYASSLAGAMNVMFYADAIGRDYSVDTWSTTADLLDNLLWTRGLLVSPAYLVVEHSRLSATGSDPYGPSYQAMRYSLGLTLMTDGFYACNNFGLDSERYWFDEFAVDVATGRALTFPDVDSGLGYLGQPSGAYQVLANGVYRRDFTFGIALMNPKGNGTRTVTLETGFRKIAGSQAPAVNDGSTGVTSVTLQARDGLILLR